jgi:hypothetical protein
LKTHKVYDARKPEYQEIKHGAKTRKGGAEMPRLKKTSLILMMSSLFLLTIVTAPVSAESNSPITEVDLRLAMAGDMILARPLGMVGTVLGTTGFILSLPFSAAGGNVGEAARKLVVEPAKYVFVRPLGHF